MSDLLNRPAVMQPTMPSEPVPRQSALPGIDTAAIDRLLIAGVWVEIEKGSLHALTGVRPPFGHDINPMLSFATPDGVQAAVFVTAVQGWFPLEVA